eukprot:6604775-Alexandrium_andersonii.AAC.1
MRLRFRGGSSADSAGGGRVRSPVSENMREQIPNSAVSEHILVRVSACVCPREHATLAAVKAMTALALVSA